jgi:hypothetical protein
MKVFLSWSGESSKSLALALYDWLPTVLQNVKPFMSAENIDKGERWSVDIAKELEQTQYGIICVTPENIEAPWVLFEAGALSKSIQNSRVSPLMLNLVPSDFSKSPLLQFQLTTFKKEDFKKLLYSINNNAPENETITIEILNRAFDRAWPELEADVAKIKPGKDLVTVIPPTSSNSSTDVKLNKFEESIEELLTNSRSQLRIVSSVYEKKADDTDVIAELLSPIHPVWVDMEKELSGLMKSLKELELSREAPEEFVKNSTATLRDIFSMISYVQTKIYGRNAKTRFRRNKLMGP